MAAAGISSAAGQGSERVQESARRQVPHLQPSSAGAKPGVLADIVPEKAFLRTLRALSVRSGIQAVVILDVDHYRALRDVHGTGATDCLLRLLAKRLSAASRAAGGRTMRLGADEFAVVVPASSCHPNMMEWAKALSRAFTVAYRTTRFSVTVSAGVALYSGHSKPASDALRCARQAVSRAKTAGGGCLETCTVQQLHTACDRKNLPLQLSGAIARGEMVPFYQPVVSLKTHQIIGVEVLARWMHPEHGLLEPGTFVQAAEDNGLGASLTRSLLQKAQIDSRLWPAHWTFALNTSPNELASVLHDVTLCGRTPGRLNAARIELEVTENALVQDPEQAQRSVALMRARGIRVSLDDFGTGYANFSQLCQIPFCRLKIDKSLVMTMIDDARVQACTQAVIHLAHNLGMTVTAEGVESAAVARRLADMGCDHAQGYYFGRPMPAAAISAQAVRLAGMSADYSLAA